MFDFVLAYGTLYQKYLQSLEMNWCSLGLKVSIRVPCCNWTDHSGKSEVQQGLWVRESVTERVGSAVENIFIINSIVKEKI